MQALEKVQALEMQAALFTDLGGRGQQLPPAVRVPSQYKIPVLKVSMVKEGVLSSEMHSVGNPRDTADLLMPMLRHEDREHLVAVLLDTKNKVLAVNTVSVGDLSSSIVHPREVMKPAIIAGAASIIISHNHPSGDPTPSPEDVTVTKRLIQAGEILGVEVLDHIIIGDGVFVSMKERGLI